APSGLAPCGSRDLLVLEPDEHDPVLLGGPLDRVDHRRRVRVDGQPEIEFPESDQRNEPPGRHDGSGSGSRSSSSMTATAISSDGTKTVTAGFEKTASGSSSTSLRPPP